MQSTTRGLADVKALSAIDRNKVVFLVAIPLNSKCNARAYGLALSSISWRTLPALCKTSSCVTIPFSMSMSITP